MAEVGFVTCAKVALCIGQVVLPAYRSKFSNAPLPSLSCWRCCASCAMRASCSVRAEFYANGLSPVIIKASILIFSP
jgi:hypothetical protein